MEMRIEIAHESKSGVWSDRKFISPDSINEYVSKRPELAWYTATFNLHGDSSGDIAKDYELLKKSGDLLFDFDSHTDTGQCKQDCQRVYAHLTNALHVPKDAIKIYFSGSKGYHLSVSWDCVGLQPRSDLHELYGKFARGLAYSEIVPNHTLDTKIYNARRMFRVPGTLNHKTGKRKLLVDPITYDVLDNQEDREYRGEASEDLKRALETAADSIADRQAARSLLPTAFLHDPLDCVRYVLDTGLPEGLRNEGAYTTALYFKALGLTKEECRQRLIGSALHTVSKVPLAEIKTTVTSAFNSEHKFGLRDNVLEPFVTQRDRERWAGAKIDEDYEKLSDVARGVIHQIEHDQLRVGRFYVPALDRVWGGLNAGELLILGGSTGTGKSEFAFHVARENANHGVPTAFISLELPNRDLVRRVIGSAAGVDPSAFWSGDLTDADKAAIKAQAETLIAKDAPLFFRKKKTMMSPDELEAMVSRLIVEQQVKLIVVDHLHFFGGRESQEKENSHVARTVMAINAMTLKHNVATICVAHFKKMPNAQYKPSLHDFRDSSAIEQTAATVAIMWRDMDAVFAKDKERTEFKLAKSRKDLPLSTITVRFNKQTRTYEEIGLHDQTHLAGGSHAM